MNVSGLVCVLGVNVVVVVVNMLLDVHRSEMVYQGRGKVGGGGGGEGRERVSGSSANPTIKRPRRPWTNLRNNNYVKAVGTSSM